MTHTRQPRVLQPAAPPGAAGAEPSGNGASQDHLLQTPTRIPLPGFVTPEWLGRRYHLTPGDIRVISGFLTENYADWPAAGTNPGPGQFFEHLHEMARTWPYIFLELSRMIETLVTGRKTYSISVVDKDRKPAQTMKIYRKCMLWNVLERAEPPKDEPADGDDGPDGTVDELMEAFEEIVNREKDRTRDEILWILNFHHLPRRLRSEFDDIDPVVGYWLENVRCDRDQWPSRHLIAKMLTTRDGPVLRHLIDEARREADRLDRKASARLHDLKSGLGAFDTAGGLAGSDAFDDVKALVKHTSDMDILKDAAEHTFARTRAAELHRALADAVAALYGNREGEDEGRFRDRLDGLRLLEDPPGRFPELDWRLCDDQVAVLRSVSESETDAGASIQAASRAYSEDATKENLDRLTAAIEAGKAPLPVERLDAAFEALEMNVLALHDRYGNWQDEQRLSLAPPKSRGESLLETGSGQSSAASAAEALADERRRHDETRAELDRARDEARREREAFAAERKALDDELSDARAELWRLKERVEGTDEAPPGNAPAETEVVPLPETVAYENLPEWTEKHFDGRVALHARAVRALKGAEFEKPELVFRTVEFLGTQYWRMKTRSAGDTASRRDYTEALERLRLDDTQSASKSGMGLARDPFDIDWEGRRLKLDRHLKSRGPQRDPRHCLRVYFTWDDASKKVVIGYLPGHMTTRAS